jgi:hypothetical protein
VDVVLYKNWAVLYTQRLQVQPIGTLLSNISGSICGILCIFGFLMGLFEVNYTKYARKRSHELSLKKLGENGEGILDKNFAYSTLQLMRDEPERIINSSRRLTLEYETRVYDSTVVLPVCTPEGLIYP